MLSDLRSDLRSGVRDYVQLYDHCILTKRIIYNSMIIVFYDYCMIIVFLRSGLRDYVQLYDSCILTERST